MTDTETETRARHLTAVLEEAMGAGVPEGLASHIAHRLRGEPRRRLRPSLLAAACIVAGVGVVFAVASMQSGGAAGIAPAQTQGGGESKAVVQDPGLATAELITLRLICENNGTTVARMAGDRDTGARRWQGRQLGWWLQERKLDTFEALAVDLKRVATDPGSFRAGTDPSGKRELLPLLIAPGAVRWAELIDATDAAMAAGFTEIRWAGVDTPWIVPKCVDEPELGGGVLIVPKATHSEPDDAPDELRATFDIYQDGSIANAGVTLLAPVAGQKDDLAPLRARLLDLRATLAAKGELRPRQLDQKERLSVPLLVRADRWVWWPHVQRFLDLAFDPEIGFWKLEVAVAGRDHEAELGGRGK